MVIVGQARHLTLHLKIKHEGLCLEELALHPQSFAGDFLLIERVQDAQGAKQVAVRPAMGMQTRINPHPDRPGHNPGPLFKTVAAFKVLETGTCGRQLNSVFLLLSSHHIR